MFYQCSKIKVMAEFTGEVVQRWLYPIKGMGGFEVPPEQPLELDEYGVAGSRRWMVVDDDGKMMNSKRGGVEDLLYIRPTQAGSNSFVLGDEVEVTLGGEGRSFATEVYQDGMRGIETTPRASAWLNHYLGMSGLHIIEFDASFGRQIHPEKTWKGDAPRAFVDGAQVHAINQATADLAALKWGPAAADVRRERPDFVYTAKARVEDNWQLGQRALVGDAILGRPRPLDRCPLPTRDPDDPSAPSTKELSRMFKEDFGAVTPQSDDIRACFGTGFDIVEAGLIRHQAKLIII